jgi:hypothetical protein
MEAAVVTFEESSNKIEVADFEEISRSNGGGKGAPGTL